MKNGIFAFIIFLSALPVSAMTLSQRADSAYTADNYAEAAELYLKAAETEGTSSSLFYNIGNTYYRLGQPGKSILYYERALKLDPTNRDARANLDFVNSRIIDQPGDRGSVMSKIVDDSVSMAHSNTWSMMALGGFIILLGAIAIYVFSSNVTVRKISFFGGLVILVCTITLAILAIIAADKAVSSDRAVVTAPSTQLSTSPRVPKDKSEQALILHEGTLVVIVDSVATPSDSINPMWLDVKIDNNTRAWISKNDVEII